MHKNVQKNLCKKKKIVQFVRKFAQKILALDFRTFK